MPKQHLNPPELFDGPAWGFSQVVVASGSRTVYLSGQVAWDASQRLHGSTRVEQMRHAVRNVEAGVRAAGGSLADVVSLRLYMVDYDPAEADSIAAALKECFPGPNPPATTWIGVQSLAQREYLIEIEAIAVID